MEYRSVIILAIVINVSHKTDAYLNGNPRDTEVKINDSTYMNCSTSLLANQVQWRHGKNYVYTGIAILEPYNERFSVEINASTGACNLVIRSVQPSDAGKYECAEDEGTGDRISVQLIVLDDDPVCKSNMHSDGVIGPNSCGIEPEEIKLSCSIKYHGNIFPVLQWKVSGDNQSITDGRLNVTSNNNEVTYTLTMKSTLGLNNSSYICQTTRTTYKTYSCTSNAIHILYVFSSEVTVNLTMNDEVSCFANTSRSCSYKWKWFSGDDISTESINYILKPKKVGMHRCEASCSIRDKSCTVQSMRAKMYLETASNGQHRMSFLALLLVPAVGVGLIIYCWRRRNVKKRQLGEIELKREQEEKLRLLEIKLKREEQVKQEEEQRLLEIKLKREEQVKQEEEQRLLGLIATIRTKAAEEGQKSILGLTILDKELFVVSKDSSEVEVYDSVEFSFSRRWNVKELIDPIDMVSCARNKCLYFYGEKGGCRSKEICRVDPNGKLINRWSTKIDWGQLSVTYESNVILIGYRENKLNEYSPDGLLIREINLSSEEVLRHPWHAIKLTNGNFVVSHGFDDDDLHRVCVVDAVGKLLKSFGGKRGSTIGQMNRPSYLSVDGNGFVLVADLHNSRVLSLDTDLKFRREFLPEEDRLRWPRKILLDESNGRLFVADNEANNKRILIFKL